MRNSLNKISSESSYPLIELSPEHRTYDFRDVYAHGQRRERI